LECLLRPLGHTRWKVTAVQIDGSVADLLGGPGPLIITAMMRGPAAPRSTLTCRYSAPAAPAPTERDDGLVRWTNAIGSVAILPLAAYLWRHAGEQAEDEAMVFGVGPRMTRFSVLNLKAGPVFLVVIGLGLFAAGLW
jgi:hypothetical protein